MALFMLLAGCHGTMMNNFQNYLCLLWEEKKNGEHFFKQAKQLPLQARCPGKRADTCVGPGHQAGVEGAAPVVDLSRCESSVRALSSCLSTHTTKFCPWLDNDL